MRKLLIISYFLVLGFKGFGQEYNNSNTYLIVFNYKIPLDKHPFKYDEFGEEIETIDSTEYYYRVSNIKTEVIKFKHPTYSVQYDDFGRELSSKIEFKDSIQVDLFLGEISKHELLNIFNNPFLITDNYKKHHLLSNYYIEFSDEVENIQISVEDNLWNKKLNNHINNLNTGDIILINNLSYLNSYKMIQYFGKVYLKLK